MQTRWWNVVIQEKRIRNQRTILTNASGSLWGGPPTSFLLNSRTKRMVLSCKHSRDKLRPLALASCVFYDIRFLLAKVRG